MRLDRAVVHQHDCFGARARRLHADHAAGRVHAVAVMVSTVRCRLHRASDPWVTVLSAYARCRPALALARGSATLITDGRTYAVDRPEVIPLTQAATFFRPKEQRMRGDAGLLLQAGGHVTDEADNGEHDESGGQHEGDGIFSN
jgi:hypothetical protein